jgi:hypothetical protein
MLLLNQLITTCSLGFMLSFFVLVFSLNMAYMARKWFRAVRIDP